MGVSCSSRIVPTDSELFASPESALQHQRIEKQLTEHQDEERRLIKCLLLGAGECGKSTIMKQMKILHGSGFRTPQEQQSYKQLIVKNTLDSISSLCTACIQLEIPFDNEEQKQQAEEIIHFVSQYQSHHIISSSLQSTIISLWHSTPIARALTRENEFILLDSACYFLDHCERILDPNYIPIDADILRSRLSTTGIIESVFKIDKLTFKMFDVGGQRGERKKWIHCFDNVTAIMFIASLSEYDQVLAEDRTRNRMKESLDLFEGINGLPWFRDIPIILFLNKADIFARKVMTIDLGTYFPHYTGGHHLENGLKFIQDEYLSRNNNPFKNVYCHVTDATNTENIAFVWKAAKHIILEQSLNRSGMLM